MAAPNYTTNLTDLEDFEAQNAVFSNFTGYTGTNNNAGDNAVLDFPIQSTYHFSATTKDPGANGFTIDSGANITWTSGWNFFLWGTFLPANAVDTDANAGVVMMVGATTADHYTWTVGGRDFGRYPYGGWQNFVADPEVTTGRTTTGAPGTNYRWVGMGVNQTAQIQKGDPFGIDVIRYGRGDVVVTDGDLGNGYATFVGMATQNDTSINRWGLFQAIAGGYLWKGLMTLGTGATVVDFRDANRVINIDNTRSVQASFNRIEVNNASSNVEWDTILITSLGTVSKGQFECIDNATVTKTNCTFTDMSTFIYQSNSDITGSTYRRCGQVTLGGATFDNCLFEESTAPISLLVANNIANVTNTDFVSSGTGYALEGFSTAGDYNLVGITFSGYAGVDGVTGNEAVHVTATTGIVNLNISGGGSSTFSIHTEGATVNIIQSATLTIGRVREGSDVYVYNKSTKALLSSELDINIAQAGTTDFSDGGVQYYKHEYTYNASTLGGTVVEIKVLAETYENIRQDNTLGTVDARVNIFQRTDRNYINP